MFELIHTDDRALFRRQLHFDLAAGHGQQDGDGESPSKPSIQYFRRKALLEGSVLTTDRTFILKLMLEGGSLCMGLGGGNGASHVCFS